MSLLSKMTPITLITFHLSIDSMPYYVDPCQHCVS